MARYLLVGFFAMAAVLLNGCGAPGQTMMKYDRAGGMPPPLNTVDASHEGTYALYPANSGNPIVTRTLHNGDQYGFTQRADGSVVGVLSKNNGNPEEIPLGARLATGYHWKYQPDR